MKKLFLTLVVSLALCGSTFAQYETHWPGFYDPDYDFQVALVAGIKIDGQLINTTDENWNALEVVAFIDGVQRSYGMYLSDYYMIEYGDPFPIIDGNAIFYTAAGGETITFMMYDHMNDIEYTECNVTYLGEPYTCIMNGEDIDQGWWDPENPVMLEFVSSEPEVIHWHTDGEWPEGQMPEPGDPVTIPDNTIVIVEAGQSASVGEITMGEGSSIVIEETGELYHTGVVEVTMQLNINGYGAKDENPDNNGYRLIGVPVYDTDFDDFSTLVEGSGFATGEYDLYMFNQDNQTEEWRNYKADAFSKFYLKQGYLYANESNVSLSLTGATVPTTQDLTKDLDYVPGKEFAGWNLLGNPYTCSAYVNMPFYVLNEAGDELVSDALEDEAILPLQGFFVGVDEAGQQCTFSTTAPARKSALNISLSQGRGQRDNAIIRFDGGKSLEKVQLNPSHTKVYMTQDGEDYAVVSAPAMGEMPLCFKAESNGSYTLSFSSREVSFNYLHLIDNMTGADVDLLDCPSYTFNAQSTDYASRFRLVFATGSTSEDSFAFLSNGSFVINNEGEATLQLVDINGRILSSETINGCANLSVNAAAGVYMLRLVNGSNVKVQKVVIR